MASNELHPVVLPPETITIPASTDVRRIVVFLPDAPITLLTTLQRIATLLNKAAKPLPMLILSRSPNTWLWHTLRHLVKDKSLLSKVYAAASDLPVSSLSPLLQDYIMNKYPSLWQISDEEKNFTKSRSPGVTEAELDAILCSLNGDNSRIRAKRRGISYKTFYNQRISGLRKIVKHYPQMASYFPNKQIREEKKKFSTTHSILVSSALEREFTHAIYSKQIFAVFQPIVDEHMQVKGMEILCRWNRNGDILLPGEFLPRIHSEYAWLLLTAFILHEAVQLINQYPSKIYFSVNIPGSIANSDNLICMLETAQQQLHQPQMLKRLLLEFSENIDINKNDKIAKNIAVLQNRGFHIMLDDCFSQGSVIFPVRRCRFDAYKLDKSIVHDMMRDSHSLSLIKSLIYYCQLNNIHCIAEGVDSKKKFEALKTLGIDRFQGYFISLPLEKNYISDIML